MNNFLQFGLVLALIAVATAVGLIWKARTGTSKKVNSGLVIDLREIAAVKDGQPVTKFGELLFCSSLRSSAASVLKPQGCFTTLKPNTMTSCTLRWTSPTA
jgi:hypothetical protein